MAGLNLGRLLAEGTGSWLRFEQICGRTELFSERYLAGPIGQILLGAGFRVTPEFKHLILAEHTKGPGKRPAVDFAAREVGQSGLIKAVIESKWIGRSRPSFDDIFWDLIRLALIARTEDVPAYFVLGGTKKDIKDLLNRKPFTAGATNGSKKFLLRWSDNPDDHRGLQQNINSVPIGPVVPDWVPAISKMLADYPQLEVPNFITTQLSSSFPHQSTSSQFHAVVWNVAVNGNAGYFRPGKTLFYSTIDRSSI